MAVGHGLQPRRRISEFLASVVCDTHASQKDFVAGRTCANTRSSRPSKYLPYTRDVRRGFFLGPQRMHRSVTTNIL